MKTFAALIFALSSVGYFGYKLLQDPCDQPLGYAIGSIDPRFGISYEDFKKGAIESESVWETEAQKDLFFFDPESSFKINLVYDDRQASTEAQQKASFGLTAKEEAFQEVDRQFNSLKNLYEDRKSAYESNLTSFKLSQIEYEKQVNYWNARRGAPKAQYDRLEIDRKKLYEAVTKLNDEADAINDFAMELDSFLMKRNSAAEEYNKMIAQYNQKYGKGIEFNQAEYAGDAINVYQFTTYDDLVLALAHEFGHYIGIGHVDEPGSVMYYTSGNNESKKVILSSADLAALNTICKIEGHE